MKTVMRAIILSVEKLPAMAGGYSTLAIMLLAAIVMFFTAHHALGTKAPSALKLVYVDNDGTAISAELISAINEANGASVELIECVDSESAQRIVDGGAAEGVLIIGSKLAENLQNSEAALEYWPAKGTYSAQAARELIAGEAVTLGSRLRSESYFEKLTGKAPTDDEKRELLKAYSERRLNEGAAVEKKTVFNAQSTEKVADTNLFSAFLARYSGFVSFTIMLILLMLGAFLGSRDEKNSFARMASLKHGSQLSFLSNFFALILFGTLLLAVSIIPSGSISLVQIAAGFAYVFCASALAMLLGGLSGSARAELASPLIAFLTGLAGGCFADSSAFGSAFKTLSRCTPQGQYIAAMNGELMLIPVLIGSGLLFLLLSSLSRSATKAALQIH